MPDTMEQQDGLIDRYLNNKLDASECNAFELMMLDDERLFARVQLLDAFKNSLIEERAALSATREQLALPFRAWLRQPLSLVASVLLAALGLQLGYNTVATRDAAPSSAAIGSLLLVEATRGAATTALSGEAPYLFQIDAGPNAANTDVNVSLRDAGGAELLHMNDVHVDGNGWARVVFNQPLSGPYTLELTSSANTAADRTFTITVSE